MERLAYVVIIMDPKNDTLRSDFAVLTSLDAAQRRQAALGDVTKNPTVIMSFPDPREVAND